MSFPFRSHSLQRYLASSYEISRCFAPAKKINLDTDKISTCSNLVRSSSINRLKVNSKRISSMVEIVGYVYAIVIVENN